MNVQPFLLNLEKGSAKRTLAAALAAPLDREAYAEQCRRRWSGDALRDALGNWKNWQELRPTLNAGMRLYREQDKSLTDFLWHFQAEITPDRSNLWPLIDFCEHYQKVHLRRGLIIYCSQILRVLESVDAG